MNRFKNAMKYSLFDGACPLHGHDDGHISSLAGGITPLERMKSRRHRKKVARLRHVATEFRGQRRSSEP